MKALFLFSIILLFPCCHAGSGSSLSEPLPSYPLSSYVGEYDSPSKHALDLTQNVAARVVPLDAAKGGDVGLKILVGSEMDRKYDFNTTGVDVIHLQRDPDGRYSACREYVMDPCPSLSRVSTSSGFSFMDGDTEIVLKFIDAETIEYTRKYRGCWIGIPHSCFLENPFFRNKSSTYLLKRKH